MSEDIKELAKQLRFIPSIICTSAADAIEALAGEVERLTANGIHTCHDECQRPLCKSYREIVAAKKHGELLNKMLGEAEARAERLRAVLKPRLNAKALEALKEILEAMEGLNEADAPYLKTLLDWHERARKALEDDKPIRAAGDGR